MKKGQKSVYKGIENLLCPFTDVYITCGPGESKYHMGTMACDIRGINSGERYPYYAPCKVRCVKTYKESGQVMWQSVNKVRFANGKVDYLTFMTCHDNTMDAYPGLIVDQGNQLGNMGTKGNATGVHCHIECSIGVSIDWWKNKYGNYNFYNELDIEDVFFMDDTNIIHGSGNWKYTKDIQNEELIDQVLHVGSHVEIPGIFEVVDINVKNNTAKVRINGIDYWLSSIPLKEVK